jgi:hypothetical protein
MEMDNGVEHQLEKQGKKFSLFLLNSKAIIVVEVGSRGTGVSPVSERGTTQPRVKVLKYYLSVKGKGCFLPKTAGRLA